MTIYRKYNKIQYFAQNILFILFFLSFYVFVDYLFFCLFLNNVFSFEIHVFYKQINFLNFIIFEIKIYFNEIKNDIILHDFAIAQTIRRFIDKIDLFRFIM